MSGNSTPELTLTAGQVIPLGAGNFFMILSDDSGSGVNLKFFKRNTQFAECNGVTQGFHIEWPGGYDRVEVVGLDSQAVKVTNVLEGRAGNDATTGTVQVSSGNIGLTGNTDTPQGSIARSENNQSFMGVCPMGSGAGNGEGYITNLAASTVNVIVTRITIYQENAGLIELHYVGNDETGSSYYPLPKLIGGDDPEALLGGSSAASPFPSDEYLMWRGYVPTNDFRIIPLTDPIILPPDTSLYIVERAGSSNNVYPTIEWIEKAI